MKMIKIDVQQKRELVDEGLCKNLDVNATGSYLYQTDLHGYPIVGDIYIAKVAWTPMGRDIVGLEKDDIELLPAYLRPQGEDVYGIENQI